MRGRASLQIRRYGRSFAVLLVTMAIGLACGWLILQSERLANPFATYYRLSGQFSSAAAVVPGLGEPVNIAGVHVGEITGTSLRNGLGVIDMEIDPSKLPGGHLYNDAHADLVPNTPLKDMQVNIYPGTPAAGYLRSPRVIPVAQTTTPVDSDELLAALDGDTRAWFTTLITELNNGTRGRGQDIRRLFMTLGPTSGQLRQITDLLAARRHALSAIVHNLGVLTKAASLKDAQLTQAIRAGNTTIQALATQDTQLQAAVTRLPGTLSTTGTTLKDLTAFSNALGPAATSLVPTARRLPTTLRQSETLFQGAALLPLKEIPPFVNAVIPLAAQLPPLYSDLLKAGPALIDSFKVLAYATNEIAYVPGGKNPGFLYWLAWFAHNADSFISNSDANGPVWRTVVLATCPGLKSLPAGPILEQLLGTNFGCK